jgi:cephalosporin hydroxylase
MEQKPEEFQWWVEKLLEMEVSTILTIGSKEGGVEWNLAREFRAHTRSIEITAIDIDPHPQLSETLQRAEDLFHQSIKLVVADSASASAREQIGDQYDAVFIDGDHSYKGCAHDFALAQSLKPRLVGFHDIVDSDWHAVNLCCVSRLWAELSCRYRTESRASGEWGGIGVVFLDS